MFKHSKITQLGIYNIQLYDPDFLNEEPTDEFQIMVFEIPKLGLVYQHIPTDHISHGLEPLWNDNWYKQEKVRELKDNGGKVTIITKRKRTVKPYYG